MAKVYVKKNGKYVQQSRHSRHSKSSGIAPFILLAALLVGCIWSYEQAIREDDAENQAIIKAVASAAPAPVYSTKAERLLQRQAQAYRYLYDLTDADATKPVELWAAR